MDHPPWSFLQAKPPRYLGYIELFWRGLGGSVWSLVTSDEKATGGVRRALYFGT